MFRRRHADPGEPGPDEAETGSGEWEAGPWDAGQDVPDQERIDFGSLLVPTGEGIEVQVSVVDNQPAWVTVMQGDSGLQLQAFAASKSGGLWQDVRAEIAAEITKAGGQWEEAEGPFGTELRARVHPAETGASGRHAGPARSSPSLTSTVGRLHDQSMAATRPASTT